MNSIRTTLTLAVCAAAVAAGTAQAADTSIPKDIKPPAYFKATLTGSQITTWDYSKPNDMNDPCDISADGHGSQSLKFEAPKNLKILASPAPKSQPNFWGTNGRPSVLTTPADLRAKITAEREGEFHVHYADLDPAQCSGDNGGGVVPNDQKAQDCGTRSGTFYLKPTFFTDSDTDDLFVPIPGTHKDRDNLTLTGDSYSWYDLKRGDITSSLEGTYENCPFELENRVERDGGIYASSSKLKEKDLFNTKKKKLTVSGSIIAKVSSPHATGQTIIAWNLKLTRVKK
jgi:hypothetical protein